MPNLVDYLQLGGTAIVALAAFWSFVQIYKNKKNGNGFDEKILDALQKQNNNHLHTISNQMDRICENINVGNDRIVEAVTKMHIDLASRLGEVKGQLK